MAIETRRQELGDFLRARRDEIRPTDIDLAQVGRKRRVPGLRREEVARAASISTDYYTRLEQGRLPASGPVLEDLARALRLTDDQRAYMAGLAGKVLQPEVKQTSTHPALELPIRRMLDDLDLTPAFVMGPRTEILGWNALAAALITDFGAVPADERYFIRLLFTDLAFRTLYADWLGVVDLAIAQLRMDSARDPDDPGLHAIVDELSTADPDFAELWATHDVAARGSGTKVLDHPLVGELTLDWEALTIGSASGCTMIIWTAEPQSPSHTGLRRLARITGAERRGGQTPQECR